MVERLRERLSTEQLKDRLQRMLKQAEAQLDSSAVTVSSRRRPRR
jgi:vacuolar-type H+-ATPase subunit E/Vma4